MRKEQLTGSQLGTDLPSEGLVGQLGNYGLFSLEPQVPRSRTPGGAYKCSPMERTRTLPHEAVLCLQAGPVCLLGQRGGWKETLRTLRESAGMTQVEMAELLKLLGLTTARSKHKNV